MARQSSEDCYGSLTSQECNENRYTAYKKLIAELSEHLLPEDLKQIIFLRSLPDILKNSSALDVLEYMEKHGKLSPTDIQSLSGLLKDVHRNDLVNKYVEEYQRKFGRHSSMPTSRSLQRPPNRRANTCPSDMKQLAHAVATSACLPVQETEDSAHGLYMPSNDTHMHSHGREAVSHHQFLASTQLQPASLTVKAQVQQLEGNPSSYTNYSSELFSHPPETTMHQFSSYQDQTPAVESYIPRGGSTRTRHLSEHMNTSAPVHYRQTSTPLPPIHHQCLPSNPLPIRGVEYENSTPASLSASNSIHDMYSIHNHAVFDQESRYTSSPSSANASQDLLSEARGTIGVHLLGCQHLEHNPLSSQLSGLHIGQRGAFAPYQSHPWYHVCNNSQEFPPSSMLDHRLRMEARYQPSSTPPPTFQRRTSVPEATLHSTQTERLPLQLHSASFNHSPYPHKKSSAPASITVSDSGVEMMHHKAGPGSTASESIEPWMSVSNEKEQFECSWIQPRPRTRSVSTGVQTENGEGSEKILTPATLSPIASIDESEDSSEGQDTGKPVVVKKSRPLTAKLKLPLTRSRSSSKLQHSIRWVLKRNKLNKAIYKHKENNRITCPTKLELDAGCGGANPRLVFHLVPYGLETDSGKNATLEIEIEVPKKCPRMHSATKVKVSVSVRELKEEKFLARHGGVEKSMNLRQFLIPQFVTHGKLKDSRCDQIEIHASAELIMYSKLTHSPQN